VAKLDVSDVCEKVEIAGAGFLNFRLKNSVLAKRCKPPRAANICFLKKVSQPKTVVIDFSSPNVAKPMHVGHIRSTGIGDALQRTLRLLGHRVISDNHIGDWGTQFGKLLLGWKQILDRAALERDAIAELERLYKIINSRVRCESRAAGRSKSRTGETSGRRRRKHFHLEGNDPAFANPVRHDLFAARREV
jgi:arginyl-tRNA synthetase